MSTRSIEVLVFEGCPNADVAIDRARAAIATTGAPAALHVVQVEGEEHARRLEFLGSPTVRVDGVDVDQTARERTDFGLQCRVYAVAGRLEGAPPVDWIEEAIGGLPSKGAGVPAALGGCCARPEPVDGFGGSGHGAGLVSAVLGVDGAGVLFSAAVRLLAEGRPVTLAQLASVLGWPRERLDAVLERVPNIERDADGALVGVGLSLRPTPHAFEANGRALFTWCALDALFLPTILGQPARVTSSCAATGVPIRLRVAPTGIDDLDPVDTVISLVAPCGLDELRGSFCDQVSFYSSAEAATDWLRGHPGASVVPVAQGFTIGQAFVAEALVVRRGCC